MMALREGGFLVNRQPSSRREHMRCPRIRRARPSVRDHPDHPVDVMVRLVGRQRISHSPVCHIPVEEAVTYFAAAGHQPDDKETGGNVTTRPRAADDFAMIRSRMVELRRERARLLANQMDETPSGPRQYRHHRNGDTEHQGNRLLPRSVVRTSVR
jgi:hypothetical protein